MFLNSLLHLIFRVIQVRSELPRGIFLLNLKTTTKYFESMSQLIRPKKWGLSHSMVATLTRSLNPQKNKTTTINNKKI